MFVCLVGVNEDLEHPNSYDQLLKRHCPQAYAHITFIGFRMHEDPGHDHDPREQERYFRFKFISYTAFLLISLYYRYYYSKTMRTIEEEKEFKEADFKKLFEFTKDENDDVAKEEDASRKVDVAIYPDEDVDGQRIN